MYLSLAWRNIWRNKRRTFITMASVFFAVILSSLMMSIKEGTYDNMIDAMVGTFSGYVQVQNKDYWDDKTLDNSLEITDSLNAALTSSKDVAAFLPRIESFALSASGERTKGVMVVGVDPDKEDEFNAVRDRVSEGTYFSLNDRSVMLGQGSRGIPGTGSRGYDHPDGTGLPRKHGCREVPCARTGKIRITGTE